MYRLAVCEDEERARAALCALCGEILEGWGVEHSVAVLFQRRGAGGRPSARGSALTCCAWTS